MKRFPYLSILASVLLCSCNAEPDSPSPGKADGLQFRVSFAEGKTFIDKNFGAQMYWHAGDDFSVFRGSGNERFCFNGKTGASEGYIIPFDYNQGFSGSTEEVEQVTKSSVPGRACVLYPYSESNSMDLVKGEASMSLPTIQPYEYGGFAQNVNPMMAYADIPALSGETPQTVDLKFHNMAALLGIKLYGGDVISSVTMRGNRGEKLSGRFIAGTDAEGLPTMTMDENALDSVSVVSPEGVKMSSIQAESTVFWFVLPPVSLESGFTLTIRNNCGDSFVKESDRPLNLERNRKYTMAPLPMNESLAAELLSFSLTDGVNTYEPFMIRDTVVHIMVPHDADLTALKADFSFNGKKMLVGDTEQIPLQTKNNFNNFAKPVVFSIQSSSGVRKNYVINLYDLPVMTLDTPDGQPIYSKTTRTEGCRIVIRDTDNSVTDLGTAGVKGRGNTTWTYPKKPYNVKLDAKASILGLEKGKKSKHWTLLSHPFYDKTQLHNDVAFEIARMMDYPWVQNGAFIEFIFNGVHQGTYYLTSKPRVEKNKIEIDKDWGYLIETYNNTLTSTSFATDYFNKTGYNLTYDLHWYTANPDRYDSTPAQRDTLRNKLNHMESLIADPDSLAEGKYRDYLDIETVINWLLVEEVTQNEEASRTKNFMFYIDKGSDKFYAAPPWDFDFSTFSSQRVKNTYALNYALYYRTLVKDPVFLARVKEKWALYSPQWRETIPSYIDERYALVKRSCERNSVMWTNWYDPYVGKTYSQCVKEMKSNFITRLDWLDTKIPSL